MTSRPVTPLLDTVDTPADLRRLKPEDLRQLADELRAFLLNSLLVSLLVSVTAGALLYGGLTLLVVRPLRRVSVRGYDHLQPWLVRRRRADDAPDEHGYDEDAFDQE